MSCAITRRAEFLLTVPTRCLVSILGVSVGSMRTLVTKEVVFFTCCVITF